MASILAWWQTTFDWGDNPDTGVGTSAGNYKTLIDR